LSAGQIKETALPDQEEKETGGSPDRYRQLIEKHVHPVVDDFTVYVPGFRFPAVTDDTSSAYTYKLPLL
jgi:hypothetical protein